MFNCQLNKQKSLVSGSCDGDSHIVTGRRRHLVDEKKLILNESGRLLLFSRGSIDKPFPHRSLPSPQALTPLDIVASSEQGER